MDAAKNLDWFQDEVKNKAVLPAGERKGVLVEIKPGLRTSYMGRGENPSLTFVFHITRQKDALADSYVSRTVTASRAERSSCMTLITQLAGKNQPNHEVISDKKKLKAFLTDLIGNHYILHTEPSKCGRFNNLLKAEAL